MNVTQSLLTRNPYSRPGTALTRVTKIAVHYVGNAGSTAAGNRNYFESLKAGKKNANGAYIYASSHYIIGLEGEITQCVPESEVAYCTNQANGYSVSIECCHPSADGKFTEKTRLSLISLCADLCERHGLDPLTDIIRHYDVTGKMCPLWYVNNPAEWSGLKKAVAAEKEKMEGSEMLSEMKIQINGGDIIAVSSIIKDGLNYPNLRELAKALGVEVGYAPETKVVTLKTGG